MHRFLYWLSGYLPCRLINRGTPYLERYCVLDWKYLTVYLHRFVSGDGDLELHDHPWRWAISLILAGHYLEERAAGLHYGPFYRKYYRYRYWVNFIWPDTYHKILVTRRNTWTLFIHGKRVRQWGWLDQSVKGLPLFRAAIDPEGRAHWKRTAPRGWAAGREPA